MIPSPAMERAPFGIPETLIATAVVWHSLSVWKLSYTHAHTHTHTHAQHRWNLHMAMN